MQETEKKGQVRYDYGRQCWMRRVDAGWRVERCGHWPRLADGCYACSWAGRVFEVDAVDAGDPVEDLRSARGALAQNTRDLQREGIGWTPTRRRLVMERRELLARIARLQEVWK